MTDSDSAAICPECEGRLRIERTEWICEDCGLVVETDAIDRGPEWRSFDLPERKRTGAPLTRSRHDRGLSTKIGSSARLRLTGRKRRQLARMRREHARAQCASKAEYNKRNGFTEIRRIVSQLSLPLNVTEQACILFESAQSEGLLRGRTIEGFAAAAVYATCRVRSLTRTKTEITAIAHANEAELDVAYAALNRELGLPTGPIDPTEYLPRYASRLGLESRVEHRARRYATQLADAGSVNGKNPSGVAAACLYAAANRIDDVEPVTQVAAADIGDVSPATIRSTVSEIRALEEEGWRSDSPTDSSGDLEPAA